MLLDISCRLCGNGRAPVWFNAWDHEIHSCDKCGFMFAVPLARAADRHPYQSNYYDEFIERDKQADMLQAYAGILQEIEKMTPGRRLLDAGCGAGGFLHFAEGSGWSVTGLDASEAAVRYSVETHHLNVFLADLNRCELPQKSYDVIWAFHVVEHLSNPLHFLKNAAAALEPSGVFYLGLPFYPRARIQFHQLLYKIGIANYPFNFGLPDHVSYFNRSTLRKTLSNVGLEVTRTWFTGKLTLAELSSAAKRSVGIRKVIGNAISPFTWLFGNLGPYQHINVIARKHPSASALLPGSQFCPTKSCIRRQSG
jgi:SAM-dependent methyltransferase